MQDLTTLSKFISLILRHKPEKIGIKLDKNGWADVNKLISKISLVKFIDMPTLETIVANDSKQRYSFNQDKTKIRANQGHSINVDVELKKATPPPKLWHGSALKFANSIAKQGLIAKNRLFVHLSSDKEIAINVGKRHGEPVLYEIDCAAMIKDKFEFFISKNGVWLVDRVPRRYVKRVEI